MISVRDLDELTRVIGRKWVLKILIEMNEHKRLRFNAIKDKFQKITPSTLSSILKDLEKQKIIKKSVFTEIPLRVEYSLSKDGKQLFQAVEPLLEWLSNRKMSLEEENVNRIMTIKAIEKVFLDLGKPELEKVKERLRLDYNCSLADCYENPEYLNRILKDYYGKCHVAIVESIKKRLLFTDNESISDFLRIIEVK